jgi:hypothetical protein
VLPSLAQHLGIRLTEDPDGSNPRR